MAKIQEKHKPNFTPTFRAFVHNKMEEVTINQLEQNPDKYINTAVGYMYEDYEALKARVNARKPPLEKSVVDMNFAKRGEIWNMKEVQKRKEETFLEKQKRNRSRLEAKRAEKEAMRAQVRKEIEAEQKAATKKAEAAAKKAAKKLEDDAKKAAKSGEKAGVDADKIKDAIS